MKASPRVGGTAKVSCNDKKIGKGGREGQTKKTTTGAMGASEKEVDRRQRLVAFIDEAARCHLGRRRRSRNKKKAGN